jgi:putative redox protein
MAEKTAHVTFVGPMRFDATSGSGHTITMDTTPSGGGEDTGASPMELVLMALAGCTGIDVIGILRKMRQDVTGYEINVRGVRAETHPMVYTQITIEHVVTGHHVDPAAVARAVELSETKYCSVSAMLGKSARIEATYRVVEAGEE